MMKILLNWLPPALKNRPSPAMSILQSYLMHNGITVFVKYWTLTFSDLLSYFSSNNDEGKDIGELLPFLSELALCAEEDNLIEILVDELRSQFPQYTNINNNYYENKIKQVAIEVKQIFLHELSQMNLQDDTVVGISSKLYQWIPGNILAKCIKSINPKVKIVLGGLGSKQEALAMMRNFNLYDFAIWGEGEYPLLQLCNYLDNHVTLADVPNCLFRNGNEVCESHHVNKAFIDLNQYIPTHTDFFTQIKNQKRGTIEIPIEGGRGCHWHKCQFCFLNSGYSFRRKNVQIIAQEICDNIDKFGTTRFVFVDNDIVGNDINSFDQLLTQLIEIKGKHNSFQINNAEVITYGLNARIIKKMALAGFKTVQIGYEAISENLLRKINKKNTFCSNLIFIKWATCLYIRIEGANIIFNLLEESKDDIIKSSNNLHFLRFYLKKGVFQHSYSPLAIASTSRYYKKIVKDNTQYAWDHFKLASLLPSQYYVYSDRFDILSFSKNSTNPLWKNFKKQEDYYLNNTYSYNLIRDNTKVIYYELYNEEIIKEIEFDLQSKYWQILTLCNQEVRSLDELHEHVIPQYNINDLKSIIEELNAEWLLYTNEDFSESVTIINTDLIL